MSIESTTPTTSITAMFECSLKIILKVIRDSAFDNGLKRTLETARVFISITFLSSLLGVPS